MFPKELLQRFKPRSIRSVAVCRADDAVLRLLLERYKGCEVRVYPARQAGRGVRPRSDSCALRRN